MEQTPNPKSKIMDEGALQLLSIRIIEIWMNTYIRMFNGIFFCLYSSENWRTDFKSVRLRGMHSTRAVGVSAMMSDLTSWSTSTLLAARTTCAPRLANVLAHSFPRPDDPPAVNQNRAASPSHPCWHKPHDCENLCISIMYGNDRFNHFGWPHLIHALLIPKPKP